MNRNRLFCAAWLCLLPAIAGGGTPGPWVGTLQSDPANAAHLREWGASLACVEVSWDRFEPKQGQVDEQYAGQIKQRMAAFRAAGLDLVLAMGVQYPPAWAREAVGAKYVDQFGDAYDDKQPGANGVNAVFSAAARAQQRDYVRQLFKTLGTDWRAVRAGGGFWGELSYPFAKYNGRQNCYWAFDDLAQGKKPGLAKGVLACPVPGWIPGQASDQHASAARFAEWYLGSLQNYHDWQIATVREAGFRGNIAMLYPSWGIRPGQLVAAVAGDLGGSTPPEINGEIQRGYDFARFIAGISDDKVIVYTTWLDPDPTFGDDDSTNPARWCPAHFLAQLAHAHQPKLEAWGENTGGGDPATVDLCFSRASRFGLLGVMWAFESDLANRPDKIAAFKKDVVSFAK